MFLHPVNHHFLYKAWYNLETTTEITIIFPSNPVKWLSPATTGDSFIQKKNGLLHGLHSAAQTFVLLAPELFFFGLATSCAGSWWIAGFPMMGMWFASQNREKMYSLKTFFVCVKPCTVYSVHGKWGSPKDQPEIAGDLPEMRPFLVQQMYRKILWFIIIIFPIRIARYFQIVWGYPHFRYTQQMMGIACGPAVPDACIRCNFDSDAPISRESLLKGPNDSVSRLGG